VGVLVGRLLAFAALLFVMASIAAAIAPGPEEKPKKRAAPPVQRDLAPAQTVRQELPGPDGKALTIRPRAGDNVELRVISDEIDTVTVEDLGVLEPVDETSPAILNFIVDRAGTYEVRLDRQEKLVGRLIVGPAR
jgi:hypothetical protein